MLIGRGCRSDACSSPVSVLLRGLTIQHGDATVRNGVSIQSTCYAKDSDCEAGGSR